MVLFLSLAIDGKQGSIYEGKPQNGTTAQVTITIDDDDFVDLASGKANAPAVYINIHYLIYIYIYHLFLLFDSFLVKVK